MNPAVSLVQSYFELNGYFTVTEFEIQARPARHDAPYETLTDLDILAVRFPTAKGPPHYRDTHHGPAQCNVLLTGDPVLGFQSDGLDLILGEVKEGPARFNPRIRDPHILHAALRRCGVPFEGGLDAVCDALAAEVRYRGTILGGVAATATAFWPSGPLRARPRGLETWLTWSTSPASSGISSPGTVMCFVVRATASRFSPSSGCVRN